MYHRIGAAAYKTGLQTTTSLCKYLGNPHLKYKTIHIGGTNGKGSTSHLLASILQSSGIKTGLYTSPHLKDFRERIRVNGRMVPKSYVTDFINIHQEKFEEVLPSFFEMTFAMAIQYFADCSVEIAIFEVGMGGRLDSTNVIKPELSIITNISLDHTTFLGNTHELIATEKAGIIKKKIPVIIGETQENTKAIFLSKAAEENCEIYFADKNFRVKKADRNDSDSLAELYLDFYHKDIKIMSEVFCPLAGSYQLKNLCTVLQATDILKSAAYPLTSNTIRKGIKNVIRLTGFSGRWQILRKNPLTICDTGHNEAGLQYVLHEIKKIKYQSLHFVIGMVNDKDIGNILSLLPKKAVYYFCRPDIPRGLDQDELAREAMKLGLKGKAYPSVRKAYQDALITAGENDLVFVGGSTFVVAEIL
ncbi:MAG: folylpolyglutamate synthase/dihydrofolate synthase family protein [Bacteroidales bacterium]